MAFLSITGVVLITSALILYSFGVWGEKYKRTILSIHIISFWLGLTADFTGTIIMASLSERIELNLHGITGMIAILLMAVHATWATIVYRGDDEQKKQQFHKYSIVVWLFWLIPYFSGMYLAMSH